jgi:hypothetical protein
VAGTTIPLTIALPAMPALAAPTDADIVFCLSPTQRSQLADAAVALKMAKKPGKQPGDIVVTAAGIDTEMTVDRWRQLRADDFNRACTALARSAIPAPAVTVQPTVSNNNGNDLGSTLTALIPVVVGALLGGITAAVASWWKDVTTTRRALAADLTSATRLLRISTVRFLDSGEDPADQAPARTALQQAWADALGVARRVNLTYRGRSQPGELEQLLTDEDIERDMSQRWVGSPKELEERAKRLRASVRRMDLLAVGTAAALERRGRVPRDWPTPKPAGSGKAAPEDKAAAE